jgi:hypothetical protein
MIQIEDKNSLFQVPLTYYYDCGSKPDYINFYSSVGVFKIDYDCQTYFLIKIYRNRLFSIACQIYYIVRFCLHLKPRGRSTFGPY